MRQTTTRRLVALGAPYSSGEMRRTGFCGYGCYEASFKPVAAAGVVSSSFTFAGPYDNGGNGKHNEIDIEFPGYDTSRVQLNFWTNDGSHASRNEVLVDLGCDAADAFHDHGFEWTSGSIYTTGAGCVITGVPEPPPPPPPSGEATSMHVQAIAMSLVSGITGSGLAHDGGANLGTCGSIKKWPHGRQVPRLRGTPGGGSMCRIDSTGKDRLAPAAH